MKSLGLRLGRWTLCDNFLSYAQPSEGESEDEVAFSTEPRERKPVWTDEDDDKIRYIHVQPFIKHHVALHHCMYYCPVLHCGYIHLSYPVLIYRLTRDCAS